MTLAPADTQALLAVAVSAAREAGRFIARTRPTTIASKAGGQTLASQVVTDIDERSQALILDALAPTLEAFDLAVLTEEREDDGTRQHRDYFWCIDPLDGTLPFVEGRAGYAVSIALVSRDGTPQLGAVHDPAQDTLYQAGVGLGLFRDEHPWAPTSRGTTLRIFADRSLSGSASYRDLVAGLERIAEELGLDAVDIQATGAAVSNACRVLASGPASYFKLPTPRPGGGSLWDFAATACMFREAGAVATDIHGQPLDLNRVDSTFMNHRGILFATDEVLAAKIRALFIALARPER